VTATRPIAKALGTFVSEARKPAENAADRAERDEDGA
jgi:hypothetical protein